MDGQQALESPVIGIDFDNTLIIYDELFCRLAQERRLFAPRENISGWQRFAVDATVRGKTALRDALRRLPGGEEEWQRLQAAVYGPAIAEARLADGAWEFLQHCWQTKTKIYIVSHKTEYANYDETQTNLRKAAIEWMTNAGFFYPGRLTAESVRFGATRQEKIAHIRDLGCTHFIDDLEEVFNEESFPAQVEKILYMPEPDQCDRSGARLATSWKQICEFVFGPRN